MRSGKFQSGCPVVTGDVKRLGGGYWRLEMRLGLVLGDGNAFGGESGPECWGGGVPPPPFKQFPAPPLAAYVTVAPTPWPAPIIWCTPSVPRPMPTSRCPWRWRPDDDSGAQGRRRRGHQHRPKRRRPRAGAGRGGPRRPEGRGVWALPGGVPPDYMCTQALLVIPGGGGGGRG